MHSKKIEQLKQKKTLFYFLSPILYIVLILLPQVGNAAYAPSLKWTTIETPHFLIHYHTGLKAPAHEAAKQAEEIHTSVTQFFNWIPKEKTHIVLSDQSESPNGTASVLPNNRIELFMAPPADISGLEDYKNWQYLVLKHEFVHIVHLDKAADLPLHGRSMLGRYYLFFPNTFLPRWLTEGLATYLETDKSQGVGRGQSSYYRGLMRNEVINGIKSLNQINQFRTQWPGGAGFYLYGVYFFNFIVDTYGEEKVKEFVDNYSHFPIPYFINTVSKMTFDKNMFSLWDDFGVYLENEFQAEINNTSQNETESITSSGFYSGYSRLQKNSLYFIQSDREKIKKLIEKDVISGDEKVITEIRDQDYIFPHAFDVNKEHEILIPLINIYESTRQSFDLYRIETKNDKKANKKTRLTTNKRYIRAIWGATKESKNNIIALGNHNGKHNLDILDYDGEFIKTIWQGETGAAINAFNLSNAGDILVVSMFTPQSGWNLHLLSLNTLTWKKITDSAAIESYPKFDNNDTHIIYSADYNKIYNIYQLSLNTGKIHQLTHSRTVALFPSFISNKKNDAANNTTQENALYFTELDKNGFNLKKGVYTKIAIEKSTIKKQAFKNTKITNHSPQLIAEEPYQGLDHISPPWWIPAYTADPNQTSLGFFSRSNDPLNWYNYQLLAQYDIKNLEFRWNFNYLNKQYSTYYLLNSRQQSFNSADLYRRESETTIALIHPYIKQNIKWNFFASFQHLEIKLSIPKTNINLRNSDTQASTGIYLNTTTQNIRAVTPHNGIIANISYEINKVILNIKNHSKVTMDAALFTPHIQHTVFELRGTIISAGSNSDFLFLGGTQTGFINEVPLGQTTYALKGYEANQFFGTNLQRISFKMHTPIAYPEIGFMRPPIGIKRINFHASIEAGRVGYFNHIFSNQWQPSIALETSLQSSFGFDRWPFNLTLGIAKGLTRFGINQLYLGLNTNY